MENIFTSHNKFIVIQIIKFLSVKDIYINIVHINKHLYNLIHDDLRLLYKLIKQNKTVICSLNLKSVIHLNTHHANQLIKELYSQPLERLPFFGFKSNTGALFKNCSCWIDKAFIPFRDNFCSTSKISNRINENVENFEFEGVLSSEVKDIYDFSKALLKQTNRRKYQNLESNIFTELDPTPFMFLDDETERMLSLDEQIRYNKLINKEYKRKKILNTKLKKGHNREELNIEYDMMNQRFGLINGIEIDRGSQTSTNPVNTLMIFGSNEEMKLDDDIMRIFDSVRDEGKFVNVYLHNKNELPRIWQSNIMELEKYTRFTGVNCRYNIESNEFLNDNDRITINSQKNNNRRKKAVENLNFAKGSPHCKESPYCKDKDDKCKIVIFRNELNKISKSVWPIVWIHFKNDKANYNKMRKMIIKFYKMNSFCCKYVVVKLISSMKKKTTKHAKNIDFGYITLLGTYIQDFNVLLTN